MQDQTPNPTASSAIADEIREHLLRYSDKAESARFIGSTTALDTAISLGCALVEAAEHTDRMEEIILAADNPVHDCADGSPDGVDAETDHASWVNNQGLPAQFAYLAAFNGPEEAVRLIREAALSDVGLDLKV